MIYLYIYIFIIQKDAHGCSALAPGAVESIRIQITLWWTVESSLRPHTLTTSSK